MNTSFSHSCPSFPALSHVSQIFCLRTLMPPRTIFSLHDTRSLQPAKAAFFWFALWFSLSPYLFSSSLYVLTVFGCLYPDSTRCFCFFTGFLCFYYGFVFLYFLFLIMTLLFLCFPVLLTRCVLLCHGIIHQFYQFQKTAEIHGFFSSQPGHLSLPGCIFLTEDMHNECFLPVHPVLHSVLPS